MVRGLNVKKLSIRSWAMAKDAGLRNTATHFEGLDPLLSQLDSSQFCTESQIKKLEGNVKVKIHCIQVALEREKNNEYIQETYRKKSVRNKYLRLGVSLVAGFLITQIIEMPIFHQIHNVPFLILALGSFLICGAALMTLEAYNKSYQDVTREIEKSLKQIIKQVNEIVENAKTD